MDCFFLVVSLVSCLFKFVLVCVVAVLGRAWPSWLFYVAFGVTCKLVCLKLIQIVLAVFILFFDCLQMFIGCFKAC